MNKKIAICPNCNSKVPCSAKIGEKIKIHCPSCGEEGIVKFEKENIEEIDFYPLDEPFAYVKILKDTISLDKSYKIIEPYLAEDESKIFAFIQEKIIKSIDISLDELEANKAESYLNNNISQILKDYDIEVDDVLRKKILYYINRESVGYGKIDAIMKDPHIEDISCDGTKVPIFLFHREYGSLKSNIEFENDEELSNFVIRLAQKCGKHISIAEPMLDATMPDGSRIQMTLGNEVTARGSTFTIRKFREDPFTPVDLIILNTMSKEMVAYMWMVVESGDNALVAGGTAAGKTSTLNALSLFIPHDSKIVSIEETREINLPHPNWIPGISRSGFGEIVADKMVGEIDMYDLMKAALRQRPEYIIVGEIRGQEAYVLFQAMATGHTTYSTFHADSAKALIHRLEGKPINIPRIMLQALDIVTIQISARVKGKRVRRCKQIVEIIDIDAATKEILTNEVFHWDPLEDKFHYSGKSYMLERIRGTHDWNKDEIVEEMKRRVEILNWMCKQDIRDFKDVAKAVAIYSEKPKEFMERIRSSNKITKEIEDKDKKEEADTNLDHKESIPDRLVLKEGIKKGDKKPTLKCKKMIGFMKKNKSKDKVSIDVDNKKFKSKKSVSVEGMKKGDKKPLVKGKKKFSFMKKNKSKNIEDRIPKKHEKINKKEKPKKSKKKDIKKPKKHRFGFKKKDKSKKNKKEKS